MKEKQTQWYRASNVPLAHNEESKKHHSDLSALHSEHFSQMLHLCSLLHYRGSHSLHCLFVPLPSGQRICCQDDEQFLFPGCQMQVPPSMCLWISVLSIVYLEGFCLFGFIREHSCLISFLKVSPTYTCTKTNIKKQLFLFHSYFYYFIIQQHMCLNIIS